MHWQIIKYALKNDGTRIKILEISTYFSKIRTNLIFKFFNTIIFDILVLIQPMCINLRLVLILVVYNTYRKKKKMIIFVVNELISVNYF